MSNSFKMFEITQGIEERGRCWMATTDIKQGTKLLQEDPILYSPLNKESCYNCFKFASKKCSHCCQVYYCSRECQSLDKSHRLECKGLANLKGSEINTQTRLLVRSLLKKDLENLDLSRNSKAKNVPCNFEKCCKILNQKLDLKDFMANSQILDTNVIGITNSDFENVAVGLFPLASFLNHDCCENTIFTFKGKTLTVFASQDIKKGQEITTNYVPFTLNTTSRLKELRDWNFNCTCDICTLKIQDSRDFIKCQNCLKTTNSLYLRCEFCDFDLQLPTKPNLKSLNSQKLQIQLENLLEVIDSGHEYALETRQELIKALDEENLIKELIPTLSDQISEYKKIAKTRLSTHLAFLMYKRIKFLMYLETPLYPLQQVLEMAIESYRVLSQTFGMSHEYVLETGRIISDLQRSLVER